ncbi:MAG: molecular chaperone HtpG [Flavobacteriales bacterium]|nr:molecular chaperone HtpG [Flavobacteriales bacterium]
MQTGTINIQTENIFPIIKKFLYSDTEIFLRELVSNAVDATQKLYTLSKTGEFNQETKGLRVEVILDKNAKTITIRDNGIGMTAEEVEKYINQIAFSGAKEFAEKYKDKDANAMIGHFGLGFYSAFMVAEKVRIQTLSYQDGSQAVEWESDGSPQFTMQPIIKTERGTDIILHIAEDSVEFLEDAKLSEILSKYCKFLPVEIKFGTRTKTEEDPLGEKDENGNTKKVTVEIDNIINNTNPAWIRKPADLSDDDYKDFYNELYPFTEDPLFHIHLNVDYPFNLTGILYFPKLKNNMEMQRNKIQLYSNQVFITDSVENIVPDFLTLLHGVIDSPDIPLNVSRSYLQADGNVKKISNHINKKVADKLNQMFKDDREDFQSKWDDIEVFIQYGMLSDEKFFERAEKFALLKNIDGGYFTIDEYKEKIKAAQTDKNNRMIALYTHNTDLHHSQIESAKAKGYDVLILDSPLASHYIQKLEGKIEVSFTRLDADTIEKLIEKEDQLPSKLNQEEEEKLKPIFEGQISKENYMVQFESLSETEKPVIITQSEFMRRMKEQQAMGGGMYMMGNFPEMYNLIINSNHPLVTRILKENNEDKQKDLTKQAIDLAMLSNGLLKGEALSKFINRSLELID